jgi:outer membrane lipoprotein SlyB
MVFVPVANVAAIQIVGSIDSQETVNDLYFVSTAPPISQTTLQTLVSSIATWVIGNLAAQLNEAWNGDFVSGRDLTSQFSFIASSALGGVAGGITGEPAPNNVTSNITFGTSLAGRNNHGSNRIPALSNSLISVNTIDSGWQDAVATAYALLIAPSITLPGGWTWVVVSRFSGTDPLTGKPIPRIAGVFHEIFSCYFTDQIVDSQKTRLPKHGR